MVTGTECKDNPTTLNPNREEREKRGKKKKDLYNDSKVIGVLVRLTPHPSHMELLDLERTVLIWDRSSGQVYFE